MIMTPSPNSGTTADRNLPSTTFVVAILT